MIYQKIGDILKARSMAVVNPVNCQGVMGRGLAALFKKKYPDMYSAYVSAFYKGKLKIGSVFAYVRKGVPKYIINVPTKDHWNKPSEFEYVQKGLDALVVFVKQHKIKSLAVPLLGCGLGGLDKKVVYRMMEKTLGELNNVDVTIYVDKE